jgi:class 3 adenylate cyclase/predicted ATPase
MDIAEWLRGLGLERYAAAFRENEISVDILPTLTAQDLRDLGIAAVGHRRKLLNAIAAVRRPADGPADGQAVGASSNASWAAAPAVERRHLTVLFCDLVGSTPLSTRLDPEDLRQLLDTYRASVVAAVTGQRGYVAKFLGDGVLAYFGWPNADETHADSAVRAGLAAIEALRPHQLPVRIGIATGLVVVGDLIGAGASQEHPAIGETPNLAARLQALAEPDTIVVSEATRAQLGRMFEMEALGPVTLKGFENPVNAWRARRETGASSRSEAVYAGGLTPLVGRDEELDLLLRRWRQVKVGEGRVVLLSGEAGIGKSRLLAALEESLAGEPHVSLRYFCSPHDQDSAFHPITAKLEQEAGFSRADTAGDRLAKLEAMLASTEPAPDDVALLASLLSIPTEGRYPALELSPQRRKERTFTALTRRVAGFARNGPVLFLFEDAHWSDPTSLELLDAVIERIPDLPVLAVISFRRDFPPPWFGRPGVSLVTLNRLDRRDAMALAVQIVTDHALSSQLLGRIVTQADGVPLFIEELTKAVLETAELDGTSTTLAVPDTLKASLMARLDRLPAAKQVAQIGSVIGREFSHPLLAAVAQTPEPLLEKGLDELIVSGLAFRRGTPPEAIYTFKHALVQDVASTTLLRGTRQELHARIAQVLEERFPETLEMQPELLAQHFAQAGFPAKAIAYCLKAGQRAMDRSATAEALAQLTKGMELLAAMPDSIARDRHELDLQVAMGRALIAAKGYSTPETGRAYVRARELCQQLDDGSQLFTVLRGQYVFHNVRAELRTARQLAEQLLALAERAQNPSHLLEAHRALGHTLLFLGEFVAARAHVQQGLALCDLPARRPDTILYGQHSGITCLSSTAYGLWFLGYPDQALATSREAVGWARGLSHPFSLAFALYYATQVSRVRREAYDTEALMALTSEQGFAHWSAEGTINQGWMLAAQGATAAGIAQIHQGLAAHRATGAALCESEQLGILAAAHGKAGEPADGLRVLSDALGFVEQTKEAYSAAELHRLTGELLLQRDRTDEPAAETAYRAAIEISRAQRAKSWELRAATSLARLWRDQGKRTEAHDLLAPTYGWFTEGFDTPDLQEAKALLDELR